MTALWNRSRVLGLLVLSAACNEPQDPKRSLPTQREEPASKVVEEPAPQPADEPAEPRTFDHAGDEGAALSAIGAMPAFSAVRERYRLLKRRSQSGIVHGLVLEGEEPGLLRLVDLTTGQGALSIPMHVPDDILVEPAMRVVAWGAWQLADSTSSQQPEWVWEATRVELLDVEPGPAFSPGMHAREQAAPAELVPASKASRRGGPIEFVILARPQRANDGWLIADARKGEAVARLLLPGEGESYGDQSKPSESETWQLDVDSSYWLEIARFRAPGGDELPLYQARTVPFHMRSGQVGEAGGASGDTATR